MSNVVFTFAKPSLNSTVVSNRLAMFVAKTLRLPLLFGEEIRNEKPEVLIIINGAFAFCRHLEDLAVAVRRAERVVWVQNDYTIKPPAAVSGAESPFRAAFRQRHRRGKAPTDFWTTVRRNVKATPHSWYVNWNALTYAGKPADIVRHPLFDQLFYYGAFRQNRRAAFERYFTQKKVPVSVSSTSQKFRTEYPRTTYLSGVPQNLSGVLKQYGLGLYIEDRKSHTEFHSPANRFYEMLSAGLPMVFEPEAQRTMEKAGYDISTCTVRGAVDVQRAMKRRLDIATFQWDTWHRPYRSELRSRLKHVYKKYLTSI